MQAKYPIMGDESIMSKKAHGTSATPVQDNFSTVAISKQQTRFATLTDIMLSILDMHSVATEHGFKPSRQMAVLRLPTTTVSPESHCLLHQKVELSTSSL